MTMFWTKSWIIVSSALLISYTGNSIKGVEAKPNNGSSEDCPSNCMCTQSDAKAKTDCSNLKLTEIPNKVSYDTQILEMSNNNLLYLKRREYKNRGLVNVQILNLCKCQISHIHVEAFLDMALLFTLDLSENNITTLEPGTLDPIIHLRILKLNDNGIIVLSTGLFKNLYQLHDINLAKNRLTTIEPKAFFNLTMLSTINLISNNLTVLKRESFETLKRGEQDRLSFQLTDNPWKCDCELKEFHKWASKWISETICSEPTNLANRRWSTVDNEDFACAPNITTGIKIGNDMDLKNVEMWCEAIGIPMPKISWFYRSKQLEELANRRYLTGNVGPWVNLTLLNVSMSDKGNYTCVAKNRGGQVEQNVTLSAIPNSIGSKTGNMNIFILALSLTILLLFVVAMVFCLCCCRRKWADHDEKSIEIVSLEHNGSGDQDKSLITAINPLTKPPRRHETPPSITSHGTELTELNRTLLDNDSSFADGINGGGSFLIGRENDGIKRRGKRNGEDEEDEEEEDREERAWPEFNGSIIGTLTRGSTASSGGVFGYQHYPPDLLAFSGGRGASPTSQASTAPDSTRLPAQHPTSMSSPYNSPSGQYPAGFKTLPHNRSVTPYGNASPALSSIVPVMPRHGYVTIPRRPRAPSWSSGQTPTSPIMLNDRGEPVYDNLGKRVNADGSSNKSPETGRSRPPSSTPTFNYNTLQRSTPNMLINNPLDRSAPEGAPEWPSKLNDESMDLSPQYKSNTLGKKIPPRPPPKPKKKSATGPLYEDEGEDGTEV